MFDDYLVQKQPMIRLDYKIRKASTHDFGKKFPLFWGGGGGGGDKMGIDVMSADYLARKQAVLGYKILHFT